MSYEGLDLQLQSTPAAPLPPHSKNHNPFQTASSQSGGGQPMHLFRRDGIWWVELQERDSVRRRSTHEANKNRARGGANVSSTRTLPMSRFRLHRSLSRISQERELGTRVRPHPEQPLRTLLPNR